MKLKYIIGISALVSLGLSACSDQMDYHEYRIQDEDFVKRDFGNVGKLTTHVYRQLDYDLGQMYSGASLCSATDEAVYSHQGNSIESYYNGSWSATNANSSLWGSCWEGISYCNLFLDKFNDLTFPDWTIDKYYNDNMIKYHNYQWEMRFMRAYYYFLLLRQYGNIPLITEYLNAEDANNSRQVSSDEVFDFIENECIAIKDTIISDYLSAYNTLEAEPGRVNNLGVLALRARAALYHASPLFSQGKTDSEKKELWRKAAVYANDCIKECTKRGMRLSRDYAGMFAQDSWSQTEPMKEIIFARRNAVDNAFEVRNFPIGMVNAEGGNCPSENLVSAYEMTNGLPIDDPNSGYDPLNPYKNRDARLSATVAVNGEKWPDDLPGDALETWYGGANSRSVTYGTPTGYYLKKYVNRGVKISGTGQNKQYHTWVLFRLGSLYLDYAEAMLNLTGSGYATDGDLTMTAAEAINMVRSRAGQPDLPAGLDLESFIRRYENERFVELAFEGHRIYDLRRWMKASDRKYLDIYVMEITKNADNKLSFSKVKNPPYITQRTWPGDKAYFWPIPQSEVLKSGALIQNPGW